MPIEPIDVTSLLAQLRVFADKLARVERERDELVETVARLRAELDESRRREQMADESMRNAHAVAMRFGEERDAAREEVARLTAALEAIEFIDYGNGLVLCPRCGFRRIMGHGAGCALNAALRGDTAPAGGEERP